MATNDEPIEDQNHLAEEEPVPNELDELVIKQEPKDEETAQPTSDSPTKDAGAEEGDDDLEEGELKDDDDDDDEQEESAELGDSKKLLSYNNNIDNNVSGFSKESSYHDNRNDQQQHALHQQHNYSTHHNVGGHQQLHSYHHHPNRHLSPNSQHQAELHSQYPTNHHQFSSNSSNNNHYRYPNDGPPPPMNHHPQAGPPAAMFPRGGPGVGGGGPTGGPMHKVNMRCRFYSRTDNRCTWGELCRFEHRDDGPGPEFDNRPPLGPGRGPPPPMANAERGQYPPYAGRHQPYPQPLPPPHGYPYDAYGHHHSTPPPPPPHSMSHWRQQYSPYPSLGHPPESVSPALLPTPGGGQPGAGGSSTSGRGPPPPPGSSGGSGSSGGGNVAPLGGGPSPSYPSPSSSAVVYERKHRLAYELAPWNDRGHPPPSKYDRGDSAGGYPTSRGFYRHHYSREPPYGREPIAHMGGAPHPGGYPNYPSAYRGGSMGPHASHFKFMSSSQRTVPPDSRRSRSNKRGHDEDESSWSDSGSEDSILGQANYSNKSHTSKISKQQPPDNLASDEPLDQGSGTPPGEPLPEDRERQEMLLNKLKEIEDLMAKKKGEQEDPV